jgi:PAS domain S-box-containing protein
MGRMEFQVHRTEWCSKRLLAALGACVSLLVIQLCCSSFASASDLEPTRLVVVLYPEANDGAPGNASADRGIRAGFASSTREKVSIHNEYLDISRFPDAGYQQDLARFLRRKYADRKVDLVIAGLGSGLDFAIKHRQEMFPQAPIVFLCVDELEVNSRKANRTLDPDVIGIPLRMGMRDSLNLALELHPQTEQVFVVVGGSKYDSFWETESQRRFQEFGQRVKLTYLTGLPMSELLDRVARLPRHSLIYYLHVFEDGEGRVHIPADVLDHLSAAANAPVYGNVNSYVGRGIVGGRVFSFEHEGERAALVGLRVFAGEKPEQIGVQEASYGDYVFDWRQIRRWGISESSLPAASIVNFKEPTVWELYKWRISGIVLIIVMQSLLIAGLIAQRLRRKRAEGRFRQAVDAAPTGMLMVGTDGIITLANIQMERLFGYRAEELIGHPVDDLMPARFRNEHPSLPRGFLASPEAPFLGGRDMFGCRKDGSEFPVEIGLSPLRAEAGQSVLVSVLDMTERRRAESELRESQRQLQELTSQLITAQENERRRIARELHDDLGQGLALLSVEIDLLGQKPPKSSDELRPRADAMSARVKQLSSSIHDLSHQLHPLKLEQLGLVAAVRGLCKELSHSHEVRIELVHDNVPEPMLPEAAVCLYRIVQEALRNVIRHSGARRAVVELRGTEDAICLRIRDDGAGFDPGAVATSGGLGLVSMRERLRAVQGEIVIASELAAGATIDAHVPLDRAVPIGIESADEVICQV